jgi:hypothetical protein
MTFITRPQSIRCPELAVLVVAVFVVLISPAAADQRAPTGNARGVDLLHRVNRTYETVKAVSIRGRTHGLRFGWTQILAAGVGIREEFVGQDLYGTVVLVSSGPRTYTFHVTRACWSPVPTASPQAFKNLYLPFPNQPDMIVGAPKRTGMGWVLPFKSQDVSGSLRIRAGSLQVDQIVVSGKSGSVIESVSALARTPRLNRPKPLC